VIVSGAWVGGNTFELDYDEVGNINAYHFRMTFSAADVDVELSERSGLISKARFHGTRSSGARVR
jgi:hypothetical protein